MDFYCALVIISVQRRHGDGFLRTSVYILLRNCVLDFRKSRDIELCTYLGLKKKFQNVNNNLKRKSENGCENIRIKVKEKDYEVPKHVWIS